MCASVRGSWCWCRTGLSGPYTRIRSHLHPSVRALTGCLPRQEKQGSRARPAASRFRSSGLAPRGAERQGGHQCLTRHLGAPGAFLIEERMKDQDKAMTALLRSMKRTLKAEHGIEVPHSALRASYLLAQGEHPHAFTA